MENNNENAIAIVNDENDSLIVDLTTRKTAFCSWNPQTDEEKRNLFNATNTPTDTVANNVNKTLMLVHIFAENVQFTDVDTGEITEGVRIVLIDENGDSYSSCSKGVFSSVKKIFSSFGMPDEWGKPIPVTPKSISKGVNKNILTLTIGK